MAISKQRKQWMIAILLVAVFLLTIDVAHYLYLVYNRPVK